MASIGSEDGDIGFQIAPMVDVVFVLMLFFMASAGSQVVERELGINLPGGGASKRPGPPPTPIMIDISGEGQVSLNDQAYGTPTDRNLSSLREWLKGTIDRFGDKDPVIIRPKPETRHERIMDVLNAAGASGVKNLTFS
jgi:biopolymer transport protein ExbD